MKIIIKDKSVNINGKEICFDDNIGEVLTFPQYYVILVTNDYIPDNNVEAFDYNGKKVWNISEIIKMRSPEAYISLEKESESTFSIISYNGVKFVIDTQTNQVISRNITK